MADDITKAFQGWLQRTKPHDYYVPTSQQAFEAGWQAHAESVAPTKLALEIKNLATKGWLNKREDLQYIFEEIIKRAESLSGAAPTERYKFETWAEDKGMIVDRLANGSYRDPMMDDRWEVWQAATAQAPSLEKAQGIEEIFAYWDCPCCSFPNCGHDHKSEIKQLLQNTLNALRANDEQERKR